MSIYRALLSDGMRFDLGESSIAVRATGKSKAVELARAGVTTNLIAHSLQMRALVAELTTVAQNDMTVLIEGETGTGKEIVAQAIHLNSPRRGSPFVVFDCGSISKSLAAAELFGYEKGAFTGADISHAGLLEQADAGTLFIDELGELPLELQPMLLGAIERKSSRRLGGKRNVEYDIRIIAATNRNLAEEVRAGRFREDLYYRLAVTRLHLPPLRERKEDIPVLLDHFAREIGAPVSRDLLAPFESYDWPGNVRELRNLVIRLAASPDGLVKTSRPSAPPAAGSSMVDGNGALYSLPELRRKTVDDLERRYIEEALKRADHNLSRAADLAGITRQSFTALAEKHGLHKRAR
jgi:DNA-binding NtrC family response regulator